ncbi:MAG: hypothetical protein QGG50_02485 [Methanopyri archaeon]|nr:hypothetical protein [Methanopyri archaeon]
MEGNGQAVLLESEEPGPRVRTLNNVLLLDGTGENPPRASSITFAPDGTISSIELGAEGECELMAEPAVVNIHAHGIIPGTPLFSSASEPPVPKQTLENLRIHLRQGTGTIISADNFCDPIRVRNVRKVFPHLSIYTLSNVNPHALAAARCVDGRGLTGARFLDTETQIKRHPDVVIGVGEVGSGATFLGGVAAYRIIPGIVRARCGVELGERGGERLKKALYDLRTLIPRESPKELKEYREAAADLGIPVGSMKGIRCDIVERLGPAVKEEMESTRYAAQMALMTGAPMLVHTGLPSLGVIERIADLPPVLVLGHTNHPAIPPDEAMAWVRSIKDRRKYPTYAGASTFNSAREGFTDEVETFVRFIEEGAADIISTDYGAGHHDPIRGRVLAACEETGKEYWRVLPTFTSTPAGVFELDSGVLAEGRPADVVLANIDDPRTPLAVVHRGRIAYRAEGTEDVLSGCLELKGPSTIEGEG